MHDVYDTVIQISSCLLLVVAYIGLFVVRYAECCTRVNKDNVFFFFFFFFFFSFLSSSGNPKFQTTVIIFGPFSLGLKW